MSLTFSEHSARYIRDSLFSDHDRAQFARDVDHVLRIIEQSQNEGHLRGVERMLHGLSKKYTRFYGLLNHKSIEIVDSTGLEYVYQKLWAKREELRGYDGVVDRKYDDDVVAT